jgi:hypothetical protein
VSGIVLGQEKGVLPKQRELTEEVPHETGIDNQEFATGI